MTAFELDARGLLCPLPVIRTQNMVRTLAPGDELLVVCTDPGAMEDIPAWCRVHGHEVLACEESADRVHIRVRVGAA